MRNAFSWIALIFIISCAPQPENIAAVDIGQGAYSSLNCRQLNERLVSSEQQLEQFSAQQRSAASGDAMGVFLLGLPISSMSGNDRRTEVAVARGHINEIERERVLRNCT